MHFDTNSLESPQICTSAKLAMAATGCGVFRYPCANLTFNLPNPARCDRQGASSEGAAEGVRPPGGGRGAGRTGAPGVQWGRRVSMNSGGIRTIYGLRLSDGTGVGGVCRLCRPRLAVDSGCHLQRYSKLTPVVNSTAACVFEFVAAHDSAMASSCRKCHRSRLPVSPDWPGFGPDPSCTHWRSFSVLPASHVDSANFVQLRAERFVCHGTRCDFPQPRLCLRFHAWS